MPEKEDEDSLKKVVHDNIWDYSQQDRRRKLKADYLKGERAERRKNPPASQNNPNEEKPQKETKNDQP